MTHICVNKLNMTGSDYGLSPDRRQAIIWTNAGISLGINFSEISIGIHTFSFKKMHLKISSAKWRPFGVGLNVLIRTHFGGGEVAAWASYQIREIAGCACAGNAGNVFPCRRFQRKPLVSDPGMHHGTCVTHVPWCMSGSLTCGDRENVPGIPGACAPAILRIWQEAHRKDA